LPDSALQDGEEVLITSSQSSSTTNIHNYSLTQTRLILKTVERWRCGCIVKSEDSCYWLKDINSVVLDQSPFKPIYLYLSITFFIAAVGVTSAFDDCMKKAPPQFQPKCNPLLYALLICYLLWIVFAAILIIKYYMGFATITFMVKSGRNMNFWFGMPGNVASDCSFESFELPLLSAREFHNARNSL